MAIKLFQNGSYFGDKDKILMSNLKLGEIRYYVQDNPNLYGGNRFQSNQDFKILFESFFPNYKVILKKLNPNNIQNHYVYVIDKIIENNNINQITIDNKGYVCIREATRIYHGLVLFIADGKATIYKEKLM